MAALRGQSPSREHLPGAKDLLRIISTCRQTAWIGSNRIGDPFSLDRRLQWHWDSFGRDSSSGGACAAELAAGQPRPGCPAPMLKLATKHTAFHRSTKGRGLLLLAIWTRAGGPPLGF